MLTIYKASAAWPVQATLPIEEVQFGSMIEKLFLAAPVVEPASGNDTLQQQAMGKLSRVVQEDPSTLEEVYTVPGKRCGNQNVPRKGASVMLAVGIEQKADLQAGVSTTVIDDGCSNRLPQRPYLGHGVCLKGFKGSFEPRELAVAVQHCTPLHAALYLGLGHKERVIAAIYQSMGPEGISALHKVGMVCMHLVNSDMFGRLLA